MKKSLKISIIVFLATILLSSCVVIYQQQQQTFDINGEWWLTAEVIKMSLEGETFLFNLLDSYFEGDVGSILLVNSGATITQSGTSITVELLNPLIELINEGPLVLVGTINESTFQAVITLDRAPQSAFDQKEALGNSFDITGDILSDNFIRLTLKVSDTENATDLFTVIYNGARLKWTDATPVSWWDDFWIP